MAVMPQQKPGRSKQNYRTPQEFLRAAEHKLGITAFSIDLAADDENAVCDLYYTQRENALVCDWNPIVQRPQEMRLGGWGFCNMEFGDIAPWVEKAWRESQRRDDARALSALLVPAGVGSNWWRDWVHRKAHVLLLNGRLCFISDWATTIDPATLKPDKGPARCYSSPPLYPKDCCLLLYGSLWPADYEVWTWPQELSASAAPAGESTRAAARAAQ